LNIVFEPILHIAGRLETACRQRLRGNLPPLEKNDNPPMCAARPFSMPF